MTQKEQDDLGKALWDIANELRGAMNADDFRDYMLSFLFLRYLSYNYEKSAKKELSKEYPNTQDQDTTKDKKVHSPLEIWYANNKKDIEAFENTNA